MKSNGVRKIITSAFAGIGRFFGSLKWFGRSRSYGDPAMSDPYKRQRTRIGTRANRKGRKRLQAPDCVPGTITYRDWLVRELGYDRRLADGYMYAYLNGYKVKMPLPTDLVAV